MSHRLTQAGCITRYNVGFRTELLLEKGYDVHGIIRRSSSFNTSRLQHLYEDQHERKKSFLQLRPSCADVSM